MQMNATTDKNSLNKNSTEQSMKGSEFMALRQNVITKRRELRSQLTPTENYLLDDIQNGTIGKWDTISEFDLNDLADSLDIQINKVYVLLKGLHEKRIIVREKTKYKKLEKIGLNPEMFGQILIDHQEEIRKKKHLKLVPNQNKFSPDLGLDMSKKRNDLVQKKDQISNEDVDIIEENRPIDSFRYTSNSFRGDFDGFSDEEKNKKLADKYIREAVRSLQGMPK